ncbi:MAG: nickel pincer cofactor biosynthesis protein LarC [Acidimicrobiia bacterium]|nr:nickel pincer cofactor biosynthesis protein LarC [Acidimicrobiia bacterium]
MRIVWFDGSAGASGDMLLGALVDAGVPLEVLQTALDPLDLGIEYHADRVHRHGLGATSVRVDVPEPRRIRHLPDILELLDPLPARIGSRAGAVFRRLAEAEAAVHRMPIEKVHFHEVGALDCVADIVGVVVGLEHLRSDRIHCSALSLGAGHARTGHGRIPVPVPAVLELLSGVAPAGAGPATYESTTPTGAALLVTVVDEWGPMPRLQIESVGMGAGTKDTPEVANLVRLVVGEDSSEDAVSSELQIEANVDDLDPRVWPAAIAAILDAGASDAWVAPITMKKGRPAFTVSALCRAETADAVRAAVFRHTSTIGLREFAVTKYALSRSESTVDLEGLVIRVKTAFSGGEVVNRSVEWEDVVAASVALERPPKDVLAEAERLAARGER